MPTYLPPLRGVSYSQAYAEAATVAPVTRAMLSAYELWHPTLATPVRFVDDMADLVATIEAGAPRNAGTAQTFVACPLSIGRPEESDAAATPEVTLSREGVSGLIKQALDGARGSLVPWVLIERLYASDDTTGPAKLPVLTYQLTGADIAGAVASMRASFADPANVSVPRMTFRRTEYPGLA
jgi:Domain of unknown function (DUF1833)